MDLVAWPKAWCCPTLNQRFALARESFRSAGVKSPLEPRRMARCFRTAKARHVTLTLLSGPDHFGTRLLLRHSYCCTTLRARVGQKRESNIIQQSKNLDCHLVRLGAPCSLISPAPWHCPATTKTLLAKRVAMTGILGKGQRSGPEQGEGWTKTRIFERKKSFHLRSYTADIIPPSRPPCITRDGLLHHV